ncbi:hypothetical protein ACQKNB_08325 [Lysinibacillus xylanilyticus]|uniref:hypothetical protein n=1 Tax=Lysinibacillus xylanilyticus TaxID=582475 RepID=UPI003D060D5B
MEDSKMYSTQDIENLKQRIETYRETLTSLKMGTSIEDYLFMKKEFDGIRTQIAHLEGLTETLDVKQNSQIRSYDEQIRLLSMQIESLNQTIEGMNQEILTALNQLVTIEDTETPTITPKTEDTPTFMENDEQSHPRIKETANQSPISSVPPSYKLLQSVAGKAINMQSNLNNRVPSARQENWEDESEKRHFNQHYFQSENTHPSQIYNGLYRNTTAETTVHFKNYTDAKEIPINNFETTITIPSLIANESTATNTSVPSIINESADIIVSESNPDFVDTNTSSSSMVNEFVDDIGSENNQDLVDTNTSASSSVNESVDDIVSENNQDFVDTNTSASSIVNESVDDTVSENNQDFVDTNTSAFSIVNESVVDIVSENNPDFVDTNASSSSMVNESAGDIVHENSNVFMDTNTQFSTITEDAEKIDAVAEEYDEMSRSVEEVNKEIEPVEKEHKKEKNSFILNFLRKWS